MTETWKKVASHPAYEVSDMGNVRRGNRMLKAFKIGAGYRGVDLHGKRRYVHQLVVEAFIGTIPTGYQPDHINFDTTDNRLENLRVVTQSENLLRRRSWAKKTPKTTLCGTRVASKGTWAAQLWHDGKLISMAGFKTEEEAHQAYLDKFQELRGFPCPTAWEVRSA